MGLELMVMDETSRREVEGETAAVIWLPGQL